MRTTIVLCSLICSVGGTACNKSSEPKPAPPISEGAPSAPAAPATDTAASSETSNAGGLRFRAPKPFVARKPKSSMRAAEFGVENDDESELAVFYFGADQGGSVDANMTRWIGQFKKPDGSAVEAKRGEREIHGIGISTVEAVGTYNGGMAMPGAAPPSEQADAMLLGAIAKGPQGAVFFKLVGPRSTVESVRPAFDQLLETLER